MALGTAIRRQRIQDVSIRRPTRRPPHGAHWPLRQVLERQSETPNRRAEATDSRVEHRTPVLQADPGRGGALVRRSSLLRHGGKGLPPQRDQFRPPRRVVQEQAGHRRRMREVRS